MKSNIRKGNGIPLHLIDDLKRVSTIGGGTRLVLKNPPKHDISYTDFVRDENGTMVYKPNNNKSK